MIIMYICICNAITDKEVEAAVQDGARTLGDLQASLGVATCCGSCAETAMEYLPQPALTAPLTVREITRADWAATNEAALSSGRKSAAS